MPEQDAANPPPRSRKWGWIFLVLFAVQALFFAAQALQASGMAKQRSVQASVYMTPALYSATADYTFRASMYWTALAIGSLVTLGGALWGFARKGG
jgi:hypothetical protein